ncbi:MAG: flagellar hook assembly protein FlgD [Deferribacterales bacterium]
MLVSSTSVDTSTYDKSKLDVDNNHGTMTQEDFLALFITQLQNQDPTEPLDTSDMMDQTATFTQIETMTTMSENIEDMVNSMDDMSSSMQMSSATSVIGMVMEYEGNTTTLTEGGAALEFEVASVPEKCTVVIRDEKGNFINSFSPAVNDTGKQYIIWDGTDADGNAMDTGPYKFTVTAYDANGEKIDVTEYGNGQVTGVTVEDGGIVYEVDGEFEVAAEDVISVRDASLL